jgi:hypothetical protein
LQFGLIVALVIAMLHVKKMRPRLHGYVMFVVVVMYFISIVLVILPSAVRS